jgi:hypothetical protein
MSDSGIEYLKNGNIEISARFVRGWGSRFGARELRGMGAHTKAIRAAVREGRRVTVVGAPEYRGETTRRVISIGSRLICRMPHA